MRVATGNGAGVGEGTSVGEEVSGTEVAASSGVWVWKATGVMITWSLGSPVVWVHPTPTATIMTNAQTRKVIRLGSLTIRAADIRQLKLLADVVLPTTKVPCPACRVQQCKLPICQGANPPFSEVARPPMSVYRQPPDGPA